MAAQEQMSGVDRAAILMLSLGEQDASQIMRKLEPMEVQNVTTAMSALATVTSDKLEVVVAEFAERITEGGNDLFGTNEYISQVLHQALGEKKARSMMNRIMLEQNPKGLETLRWMEPKAVANILKDEHPQICAIVVLSIEPEQAALILKLLPEDKQPEIMMRVASMDVVNPAALNELDELMRIQLAEDIPPNDSKVDGVRSAAQILNFLDTDSEARILEQISDADDGMGDSIRDQMFIFENLMSLEDRDMQRLLREIETEALVVSLKGAEEAVRERFFKNMSKRAAELLRDDIDMRGPVKLSEVEGSQKEILTIAARLAEEGEINMGGKGDEEYV